MLLLAAPVDKRGPRCSKVYLVSVPNHHTTERLHIASSVGCESRQFWNMGQHYHNVIYYMRVCVSLLVSSSHLDDFNRFERGVF